MKKVLTLGELMLRLTPMHYNRFVQSHRFRAVYGGGEANVAISMAKFGYDTYFISKIVDNEIGDAAINQLREFNVNTDYIIRGGERMGLYYSEIGSSQRAPKVIYDRKNSSIARAKVEEFDFKKIFKDASLFFVSGILPALSKNCYDITLEAMKEAKRQKVMVAFDLNWRSSVIKLEDAVKIYNDFSPYIDILIGILPQLHDVKEGELTRDSVEKIFREIYNYYGFKYIVSTLRQSLSASDNTLSAAIFDGKNFYESKKLKVRIVDRVGGGDAFAAGLLSAILDGKSQEEAIDFAVAASSLKHTIKGDFNLVSKEKVQRIVNGNVSGRIDW
ncbi:MAG: sugar kinase [Peptoniphilaceae bacterium]|nr:sugar kinase [Peptoniphilaceae bacterium]MDY6019158.1 sugar kinase [Anaerococcus sp.]